MTDRVTELEEQVAQLKANLALEAAAKQRALEDLADETQAVDGLLRQLTQLNAHMARESDHASALEAEVAFYRERYLQALTWLSAAGRATTIANAARDYLAAIERRGSLEDDVVAHLERLRDEVGFSLDHDINPMYVIVMEREEELEGLRRRLAELKDDRDLLTAKFEDVEGQAADWQELAETNDRQLMETRTRFNRLSGWPAEARHALGHVAGCDANCESCRRIASEALDWGDWSPSGD